MFLNILFILALAGGIITGNMIFVVALLIIGIANKSL